jgi:serine/threonine protein kinase
MASDLRKGEHIHAVAGQSGANGHGDGVNPFHIEHSDAAQNQLKLTRHVTVYDIGKKIGEGAYGAVFLATDGATSSVHALKRVAWSVDRSNNEGLPVTTLREIMLLYTVQHENVVRLKEVLHGTLSPSCQAIA